MNKRLQPAKSPCYAETHDGPHFLFVVGVFVFLISLSIVGVMINAKAENITPPPDVRNSKYWTTVIYPVDDDPPDSVYAKEYKRDARGAHFIVYTGPGVAHFTHWIKLPVKK